MRLQCCWQKSGDVTVCQASNLTVSPTCFQRHAYGSNAGLKIRWGNTRVGSSPTFGNSPLTIYMLSRRQNPLDQAAIVRSRVSVFQDQQHLVRTHRGQGDGQGLEAEPESKQR